MGAEAMGLVRHAQPSAQKNTCQEILEKYEPIVGVLRKARMLKLFSILQYWFYKK
jgi:hypothetical protein